MLLGLPTVCHYLGQGRFLLLVFRNTEKNLQNYKFFLLYTLQDRIMYAIMSIFVLKCFPKVITWGLYTAKCIFGIASAGYFISGIPFMLCLWFGIILIICRKASLCGTNFQFCDSICPSFWLPSDNAVNIIEWQNISWQTSVFVPFRF